MIIVYDHRSRSIRTESLRKCADSYYRARYYDPLIGRFLSEDPVRFKGGIDFYTYVANSPLALNDPLGLAGTVPPTAGQLNDVGRLFPGSVVHIKENYIVAPMKCGDVLKTLETNSNYATPNNTQSPWYNPWLFNSPAHQGGTEVHGRPDGLHFRVKQLECGTCQLDQFHIDPHNPLYHPVQHFLLDFIPWVVDTYGPPIAPLEPTIPK